MNYYTELLESYSLLKKRALRVTLTEAKEKAYSQIIRSNPNLAQPVASEMQTLTGMGTDKEEPQIEQMKKVLTPQSHTSLATGETITYYTAQGDTGPVTIIGSNGRWNRQGWKVLQSQVARRLDSQNPDMQNPYQKSGREVIQDPLSSDTAKTQEEELHQQSTSREIRLMSTTTLPNLITAGFAGDPGSITKEYSDAPGWVKDPKNHLDSYAPQSLWSKVNNEKVTEIAKIIEEQGGSFTGTRANWEDKHEGVTAMHEFAKKCLKLQQFLNGDEGAFTENDARWVHTNVILDTKGNKVRYSMGEIDGYGISFDHTTTKRSKQKETMSVGLARIYNEKIQDWVDEKNKKFPEGEQITVDQFKVPEKSLEPEQMKSPNWCSDFRGKQTEKIVGFVPQFLEISKMISDYNSQDKRTVNAKELKDEIERKKNNMAKEMAKIFSQSEAVLAEAFKVKDWDKKGEILSDEYTEGIIQTVDGLKKLGKSERDIVKTLFKRVVSNQLEFFKRVDSDFVFQGGDFTGPSEKADVYVTKLDRDSYLKALENIGVSDAGKRERIAKENVKTLREMLMIEAGSSVEGLEGENLDKSLRDLLKTKTLYRDLKTKFDLDQEVYTIPLSLKTYITTTDTRLGQTRNMRETIGMMLNPEDKKHYKKNQRQERVEEFVKQNEKSLGVDQGPARDNYRKVMRDFSKMAEVGDLIKGNEKIKNMKPTEVVRVVQDMIRQNNAAPSLSDQFLLDYLTKNYERDKEDGREAVRLATFVERKLYEKAEENILKSKDADRVSAYKAMLGSIAMFTGMSGDSTFAMEVDLLGNKSKFYNQDDCIKDQAVKMKNGELDLTSTEASNDFGNLSLKFERKGNSSVFGLKSKGCENIFKGSMREDVLKAFLKAQEMLFETLL